MPASLQKHLVCICKQLDNGIGMDSEHCQILKSPYLFLGSEVKAFLKAEAEKHKTPLNDGEFYCLSCRKDDN